MKNFFISYNHLDSLFATWVAELLEQEGYSVIVQEWDFRPGDNFVGNINEALMKCQQLIMILSENYIKSKWCESEWTSKYFEQINANERRLIPIRISSVNLEGLLSNILYIDVLDTKEEEAKRRILKGIIDKVERKSDGYPSYFSMNHKEIDVDYYVEESSITYIKSCKSTVMVGGNRKIHNRITWFADEEVVITSLTEGVTIEYCDLRDTNINYNVVFDHDLKVSEEVEFRIKAVLSNRNKHFANFFSTEVIVPIEVLAVHLNISDTSVKHVYTQKLLSSPMNVRTEKPIKHVFYSPHHWRINKPEVNCEYKVYW